MLLAILYLASAPGLAAGLAPEPVPARSASWSELLAAGFEPARLLPPAPAHPLGAGPLAAQMEQLLALRFDPWKPAGKGAALTSLGDLLRELRARGTAREEELLLAALRRERPELWAELGHVLSELGRERSLRSSRWSPARSYADDGILEGEAWSLPASASGPWRAISGSRSVFEAALLIEADLEAIKQAENDYPRYPLRRGARYDFIRPLPGSYLRGEDEHGSPFARLAIEFRCPLPFPFSAYSCELEILNRLDERGRLVCDIYSASPDFHWIAGRDLFLPVEDSSGAFVGLLLVRSFGFDLAGIPDGDSARREALRGSLGNLKLEAEALFGSANALPRTLANALPSFEVR